MKNFKRIFIALIIILSSLNLQSQTFSEVVIDSSFTKETLYSNSLSFFATTFKSANAVIQMKDPESGKVIGKGIIDGKDVTITITSKDKKYKYEIDMITSTEITLPITQLGNLNSPGVTIAPVKIVNGKSVVIKDAVYFKYNNGSYKLYKYIYNSEYPGHYPAPLSGKYYQSWKELVDQELLKPEYQNLAPITDSNITFLKNRIKEEMSKSDF